MIKMKPLAEDIDAVVAVVAAVAVVVAVADTGGGRSGGCYSKA